MAGTLKVKKAVKKHRRVPPPDDPTDGGRLCGYRNRSHSRTGKQKFCKNPAGFHTAHPGQGRCWKHYGHSQGSRGFVHPYQTIQHERLAEKYATLSAMEYDVLDLVPEAHLLRVLIVDFINRYEDITEALLRWHKGKTDTKPRRVMDIADASRMIDGLSKVVERIHKMRSEGAISLETFRRVTEAMGIVVARHVASAELLGNIEREWNSIAIDAKRPDPVTRELPPVPYPFAESNGDGDNDPGDHDDDHDADKEEYDAQ